MTDVTLSGNVARALGMCMDPTKRAAVTTAQYRDCVEQGILDIPPELARMYLATDDGEHLTLRALLAMRLAEDLLQTPVRPVDVVDAMCWYRELDDARGDAPNTWARAQHNLALAWLRRSDVARPVAVGRAVAALEQALTVRTAEVCPPDWADTVLALAEAQRDLEPDGLDASVRTLEQALRDAPAAIGERRRLLLKISLAGALDPAD